MPLPEFLAELDQLGANGTAAFAQAVDAAAVEAARVEFLGAKSGQLKAVQKGLGSVAGPDKPAAGKRFNEVKLQLEAALAAAQERLASGTAAAAQGGELFDPTLPGGREFEKGRHPLVVGHLHPITQTIEELKDIMGRLGFTVAEGPEIEDEWHNFEALNIPVSHPARDPLENFYLATANVGSTGPMLLRSQTSTVQIRIMEKQPPPVRIISLGRVYRPDDADATHYPMFHQIEGLLIDRHATMADLKSVLRLFAASFLGHDVHIRFRPSFFPFTEPSVEVDMAWETVGGKTRYVEMGGAGMVDPHVLKAVGYDPEEVTGFAFGLGVERVCARRHGVADIREFYRNDVRFLRQF
ncbi:MAG TPA: phenylalanine--tRNA ligase subunit alpha [Pirellulales bacterium]|jgi:phenylalanyl-tRNA synthetase alpha chain|nr:phenylalanine--tRNA ligase subunit alpha [Pirellulales bacterium]